MKAGPARFNVFSLVLVAALLGIGYGGWKLWPVYRRAWAIDQLLSEGAAQAYKLYSITEPRRTVEKETLVEQLRAQVVARGVLDPAMTLRIDYVGDERVDAVCDYRVVIFHPVGGLYSQLAMHRSASTSLDKTRWSR